MTLPLIFIFLLVLENLFLPALVSAGAFLIVPLFAVAVIIYGENKKFGIILASIFLLIEEYISGAAIGSFITPFLLVAGIYIWLNLFLNISSGLRESKFLTGILAGILTLLLFIYLYSALFIFFGSSYNVFLTWEKLKILLATSILQLSGWAAAFSILFKYMIRRT